MMTIKEISLFMVAMMLSKVDAEEIAMGCITERSNDNQNHFLLLKKREKMIAMV